MTSVVVAGFICMAAAFVDLPYDRLNFNFLVLCCFTIGVGSRVTVQIPRFKSHVAVSDTFLFLALLIFGGELAIILSAVEACFSSWRFCNKKVTVVFNSAAMAVSMTAVVVTLKFLGLYSESQLHGYGNNVRDFMIALSVIAVTQFLVNTSLASIYDSLKNSIPLWETWMRKYIWTFLTYLIGAACAGLLVQLSDYVGYGIIIATFPVIFFLFLSYRMYLRNIEISMRQAEQAEEYAEILEKKSDALRKSEERFRSAFHHAPIGIALVSSEGKWLKVNHALTEILGYSAEELLKSDFQSMIFADDRKLTLARIDAVISGTVPSSQMEHRYLHRDGRTVWASWSVSLTSGSKADDPDLIFQIQDITDKKVAEKKLQHEATHDELTGLPNRSMFMGRLSEALAKTRSIDDYCASVLFIDLDRFKYVNDSLGHLAGDELLVKISERLRECLRPMDTVARLGGDEFVVLVEGKYDAAEVVQIAERIQQKFRTPFYIRDKEVYSSASMGILHASDSHYSSEDMMRDADTAMYQAKKAGKARHEIFDEKMHTAATETLQLETDLRRAVEKEDFSIEYQPIFSLSTGEVEGVEALARWNHPTFGNVCPDKFISLAEEIGVIDTLGKFVLRQACTEIQKLDTELGLDRPLLLSVNLSCRQFANANLPHSIKEILAETGFRPRNLRLEITESVFFEYQDQAVEMLAGLCEMGIELNVDDFGTGYSNLSCLMRLPISMLKIDRSFVSMIGRSVEDVELVRAIVSLARTLGLRVVGEGVENPNQLAELKRLNCDAAQGFLFAAPMNIKLLTNYLRQTDSFDLFAVPSEEVSLIGTV